MTSPDHLMIGAAQGTLLTVAVGQMMPDQPFIYQLAVAALILVVIKLQSWIR